MTPAKIKVKVTRKKRSVALMSTVGRKECSLHEMFNIRIFDTQRANIGCPVEHERLHSFICCSYRFSENRSGMAEYGIKPGPGVTFFIASTKQKLTHKDLPAVSTAMRMTGFMAFGSSRRWCWSSVLLPRGRGLSLGHSHLYIGFSSTQLICGCTISPTA